MSERTGESVLGHDDEESLDASPLGLTPREVPVRTRRTGRRRWVGGVVLVAVIAGLAVVVVNGLDNATVFFYNVDQAVAKRTELGSDRFRIQGNVIPGSVTRSGNQMKFTLKYHGVKVAVVHSGDVPDLFKPSIPVVLEGHFDGAAYRSDRMFLRHDSTYDAKNPNRTRAAEEDAKTKS